MRKQTPQNNQIGENHVQDNVPQAISTKRIKSFVSSHLPTDHPLRHVVMAEKEKLTGEEFLAKMDVWLVLIEQRI